MINEVRQRLTRSLTKIRELKVQFCNSVFCRRLYEVFHYIHVILFTHQTTNTRFFFGLTSIFFGIFMTFSPTVHNNLSEYVMMRQIAPHEIWGIGFIISGSAMLYGLLFNTCSKLLLLLEGTLSVAVWVGSAYAVVVTQKTLGAQCIGALIALWIYVRYPTHWERVDGN